ncbi:MAG: HD domain-containing protein [Planctomycetota bacterium]|nr:MAG: HD domain-containing protein [Planctomycetota bacterium]
MEGTDRATRAATFAVAGLLHDVGKILEPARVPLPERIERMSSMMCPTDRRTDNPTHRHVLFTALALDRAETDWGGLDSAAIFRLACNHHRPSGDMTDEQVMQAADRLASGHDRARAKESKGSRVTGLLPVLAGAYEGAGVDGPSQVPTRRLAFDEESFLPASAQTMDAYREACAGLDELVQEGLNNSFASPDLCVESVAGLMQRVASNVPASRSTAEVPDVSLYDHSRVVAAFASCIGASGAAAGEARFRILVHSIGGIQDFIFRFIPALDVTGSGEKGRARALRARSFLVRLLSHLVTRRVLDRLSLPIVHELFDAGGRSLLLLPGDEGVSREVRSVIDELHAEFARETGGLLRLDIALGPSFGAEECSLDSFGATLRAAHRAADVARRLGPVAHLRTGDGWRSDGWVGRDPSLPLDRAEWLRALDDLGRRLPGARFLSINNTDEDGLLKEPISLLGMRVQLHDREPREGRWMALTLNDTPVASPLMLVGTHVPRATPDDAQRLERDESRDAPAGAGDNDDRVRPGAILPFDKLVLLDEDPDTGTRSAPMLGVLKADVDRLGRLMAYGYTGRESFGRLAGVSRSLDLFFKGFLEHALAERHRLVYTVFAGGDDLMLIGPWRSVTMLAGEIRGWLSRHACGHAGVTLSAGLVYAQAHSPIGALARAAEEALEAAKDAGRNRLSVLGSVMEWEAFDRALDLHRVLLESAKDEAVCGRSLIYRLMRYGRAGERAAAAQVSGGRAALEDLKWRAQLSYDLKRNVREVEANRDLLKNFRARLVELGPGDGTVLRVAATIAMYRLRGDE